VRKVFIPPDVLAEIEKHYRACLPLPNPDVHDVIGKQLEMDPKKVFFAIGLIRQRMKLPKIDFPKRPLACTPDQLTAVQALYEPYLPEPPIGIHKIIAKQLKMDEWRVHVAIKLIRKSRNLPQWNEDRTDLPEEVMRHIKEQLAEGVKLRAAAAEEAAKLATQQACQPTAEEASAMVEPTSKTVVEEAAETEGDETPAPKKRGRPKKEATPEAEATTSNHVATEATEATEVSAEVEGDEAPAPKKRGRPKKVVEESVTQAEVREVVTQPN
jgi:hypothetical protein